jgi:hypothetical protein
MNHIEYEDGRFILDINMAVDRLDALYIIESSWTPGEIWRLHDRIEALGSWFCRPSADYLLPLYTRNTMVEGTSLVQLTVRTLSSTFRGNAC